MKFIRLIFFSALTFFVIASVIAFFIPSRIQVFRMVKIAPGRDSVLNNVSDLAQWKTWYPGFENIELENTAVRNGKIVKASAKGVTLDITNITDSAVVVKMQKSGRPVISTWQINKDLKGDSLVLQGYMSFDLKWYPWEKFSSLLLDKSYGSRIEQGLKNLKNRLP